MISALLVNETHIFIQQFFSGSRIWLAESLFQVCDILVITELQLFNHLFHSACNISHSECHGGHPNPL